MDEKLELRSPLLKYRLHKAAELQAIRGTGVEWYIKLFLGVHFAANWVSVH
jgi:hypothetical protein